jgi:CheY-like chemotaxis protein
MSDPVPTILLVENDEEDVELFQRAVQEAGVRNPVQVVPHGRAAVEYLAGAGRFSDRERFPRPFLVFLDLRLSYMSGFDVLRWMRWQPQLTSVAVAILTYSDEKRDRETALRLGARSYLLKPLNAGQLQDLVRVAALPLRERD